MNGREPAMIMSTDAVHTRHDFERRAPPMVQAGRSAMVSAIGTKRIDRT